MKGSVEESSQGMLFDLAWNTPTAGAMA